MCIRDRFDAKDIPPKKLLTANQPVDHQLIWHWGGTYKRRKVRADQPVDHQLIWRWGGTYKRPKGRASAKNLRDSAIGVRNTRDFVRPVRVCVAFQRDTSNPTVRCDLKTARDRTRAPQPQYEIP